MVCVSIYDNYGMATNNRTQSTRRRRGTSRRSLTPKRPSELAKENGLTADQEYEIREAFSCFSIQHPDFHDSPEGVLREADVRRCLDSLGLRPSSSELPSVLSTVDPLNTGFVPFVPFFEYAALAIHNKADEDEDEGEYDDESGAEGQGGRGASETLHAAYSLFTHGTSGPITMQHLRRVAKELREEVDDDLLRDMIVEANGAVKGNKGDPGGVGLEEFEAVMRRAGITFS